MKRRETRRNVHSSTRRHRNSIPDLVDMISALPDPILGTILSFLPTKQAVATSVLSKRFQFMWRIIHNLEFFRLGGSEQRYEGEDMRFVEFVNRVLLLHDSSFLNKFTLFWRPRCIVSHLMSWIETAIAKNVHDLFLCVEIGDRRPQPIEMPISVFNCDSLRCLELEGGISFDVGDIICLPRLESLKLSSVDFMSTEAFEMLISGCPMLNYLLVDINTDYMINYFQRRDDDFTFVVSSTSLRCFVLLIEKKEQLHFLNFYCNLELKTPSLEYLSIDGHVYDFHVEESMNSLVEVELMIDLYEDDFNETDICNVVVDVVRALNCAKTLNLSPDAMWALNHATVSLSTEFKRLATFVTECYCSHCCVLQDFFQSSDNLEDLTIYQGGRVGRHSHHSDWNAPLEVPKCLSNSLKKIEIHVYCGLADEREMIRYILKHGSALEVVKIALHRNLEDKQVELIQEICKFPRTSPSCEVEIALDQYEPDLPVVRVSNLNKWTIETSEESE